MNVNGVVEASVKSRVTNFAAHLSFVVVPKITSQLPAERMNIEELKIPKHVVLADPFFYEPHRVDMLLGQELFLDLLCIGQIRTPGLPTLQKTRLGWIVGGQLETNKSPIHSKCHLSTLEQRVNKQLQRFWNLQEEISKPHLTFEEIACEDHYKKTIMRDSSGRYVVSMPLRGEPYELGDSKDMAIKRLRQVEKRLARDPSLQASYKGFKNEYIQLGHMTELKEEQPAAQPRKPEYFLPHHPGIKEDSSTAVGG